MNRIRISFILILCQFFGVNTFADSILESNTINGDITIHCGQLLNGIDDNILQEKIISINEGLIQNIETYNKRIPRQTEVLDL